MLVGVWFKFTSISCLIVGCLYLDVGQDVWCDFQIHAFPSKGEHGFIGVDPENITCHGKVNLENNASLNAVSLLVLVVLKVDDICHCQSNKIASIGAFVNIKDLEAKRLLRWQTRMYLTHVYEGRKNLPSIVHDANLSNTIVDYAWNSSCDVYIVVHCSYLVMCYPYLGIMKVQGLFSSRD